MGEGLLGAVLRAETTASRMEAMLLQDPVLGGLWRLEAGLTEAVRSVALEDIPLRESDLLIRIAENRANDIDARGFDTAMSLLRGLRIRSLDLNNLPDLIRRVDRTVQRPKVEDAETEEIVSLMRPVLAAPVTPILTALRASAIYATLTDRSAPVAERLLFVLIEGALRAQGPDKERIRREAPQEDLSEFASIESSWIALPATALLRQGFRTWSPASEAGVSDFLDLIGKSLEWELGALGELRNWLAQAREAAKTRHGRSRRADLISLLARRPILSSGMIVEELAVTRKTALNLLEEAEGLGILVKVTPRGHSRLWASRTLAKRLGGVLRRSTADAPKMGRAPEEQDVTAAEGPIELSRPKPRRMVTQEDEEAMTQAYAGVDDALRAADAILARYASRTGLATPKPRPRLGEEDGEEEGED